MNSAEPGSTYPSIDVSEKMGDEARGIVSQIVNLIDSIPTKIGAMEEKQTRILQELHEKRARETEEKIRMLREKAAQESNELQTNPTIHLLAGQVIQIKMESEKLENECNQFALNIEQSLSTFSKLQNDNAVLEQLIVSDKKQIQLLKLNRTESNESDPDSQVESQYDCSSQVPSADVVPDERVALLESLKHESDKVKVQIRNLRRTNVQATIESVKLKLLLSKLIENFEVDPAVLETYVIELS